MRDDRPRYGDRDDRSRGARDDRPRRDGGYGERPRRDDRAADDRTPAPVVDAAGDVAAEDRTRDEVLRPPDDVDPRELDGATRAELNSLGGIADAVARHLVATGQLLDDDPELALAHALAARRLASRVAAVREAVGLAAYRAGEWSTAIAELRAYHRMSGTQTHLAVLADCERALGRPERAVDLYRTADRTQLDQAASIELLIVAAGARGDLGQREAAASMLQVPELTADTREAWLARLRYAYAEALLSMGRVDEARTWFARTIEIDEDPLTDATERLLELDGVVLEVDDDESADDELDGDLDTQPAGPTDDTEDDDDEDEDTHDEETVADTEDLDPIERDELEYPKAPTDDTP